MKKRILVLLSVVALMVVMLATSVAPGFAARTKPWICTDPTTGAQVFVFNKSDKELAEARGAECTNAKKRSPI